MTAVSLSSGCSFPHVVTTLSQKSGFGFMCVFTAHLINSGKRSMLLLLCTKQCMGFSTCYDCSLSNSGCSLSCAFKAHLVSSGWISICCDCCFTKQWMWFSTCCQYSLSQKSGFGFMCVFTAHLINSGKRSICCYCYALSSVWGFPHAVTALFQTSVDAVFLVLSKHI